VRLSLSTLPQYFSRISYPNENEACLFQKVSKSIMLNPLHPEYILKSVETTPMQLFHALKHLQYVYWYPWVFPSNNYKKALLGTYGNYINRWRK
jgi:hypothetical protein